MRIHSGLEQLSAVTHTAKFLRRHIVITAVRTSRHRCIGRITNQFLESIRTLKQTLGDLILAATGGPDQDYDAGFFQREGVGADIVTTGDNLYQL